MERLVAIDVWDKKSCMESDNELTDFKHLFDIYKIIKHIGDEKFDRDSKIYFNTSENDIKPHKSITHWHRMDWCQYNKNFFSNNTIYLCGMHLGICIDEFYEDIISGTNGIQGIEAFIILNASIVSPWNNISDVINFDKFKYVWYNYHDNSMTPIKNMF